MKGEVFRRRCLGVGCWLVGTAVAMGAFGAHSLQDQVSSDVLSTWKTAALYQSLQGLGLVAVSAFYRGSTVVMRWPFVLLIAGTFLFSGSLYGYVLTGKDSLALVTPAGGVLMIVGWLSLGVYGWFHHE